MTADSSIPPADAHGVRRVRVDAPSRGYDVLIGELELIDSPTILGATPGCRKAVVFTDAGIPEDSRRFASTWMGPDGRKVEILCDDRTVLAPSESAKTIASVQRMVEVLTRAQLDRDDLVVACGGGVIGDLAGFAAATYRRGVRWINLPTTLLSMVDASVGGKTGANVEIDGRLIKNMVGAFWQPSLVIAHVGRLATLPDRHLRAGLAECFKHSMLSADFGDPALNDWTLANLRHLLRRVPRTLIELVARNVAVKAAVVGQDEREEAPDAEGGRALLNLGHTFGHAIETLPHLSPDGNPAHAPLHHGEAVALGLVAASAAAESLGIAPSGTLDRTKSTLTAAGLPIAIAGLPPTPDLIALMQHDKKVARGQLRLVLPAQPGHSRVVADPPHSAIEAGWQAIRA